MFFEIGPGVGEIWPSGDRQWGVSCCFYEDSRCSPKLILKNPVSVGSTSDYSLSGTSLFFKIGLGVGEIRLAETGWSGVDFWWWSSGSSEKSRQVTDSEPGSPDGKSRCGSNGAKYVSVASTVVELWSKEWVRLGGKHIWCIKRMEIISFVTCPLGNWAAFNVNLGVY